MSARIAAPAARVWEFLSWRGAARLRDVAVIERIVLVGDGADVGAVRELHLKDGSVISEYVEAIDDAARWYIYRPTTLGSLPVRDYTGFLSVEEQGPGACSVTIESSCIPVGLSAAAWRRAYTELETAVIEFVRQRVE